MTDRSIASSTRVEGKNDARRRLQIVPSLLRAFLCVVFCVGGPLAAAQENLGYALVPVDEELRWPWSVAELPEGGFLTTEREGRLIHLRTDGSKQALSNTPKTYFAGQGGYFDVVLAPDFEESRRIYLSYADGDATANGTAIFQARFIDGELVEGEQILRVANDKDTPHHYGGRLLFLQDKSLLLTTGEGFEYREQAQSLDSELGKVLRVDHNGGPLGAPGLSRDQQSRIWTYGHRNPQGLVQDPASGVVYVHEHGPRGGDELNVLAPGLNFGWPAVTLGVDYSGAYVSPFKRAPNMVDPIWSWVPSIAPSGMAWYDGSDFPAWRSSLFLGGLVNREVRRLEVSDGKVVREEALFSELEQRIRDVRVFRGVIYLLTDGETASLIKVVPR